MTFHKCQAYLFYTDYAKLRVVSYPVSTVCNSGSAATFCFKVWGNNAISSSNLKFSGLAGSHLVTNDSLPLVLAFLVSYHICFMW